MQFLDGRKPRQPERLARDHDDQRQRGDNRERQPEEAEAFAARKQILDQVDDAEPEPEQHQPAGAAQNSVPQRKPRRTGTSGASIGTGSSAGSASGVICTVPRAGRLESSGIHHDHAGIVELEGRRPPMGRFLAHCSRSPIRNWRARSRRM